MERVMQAQFEWRKTFVFRTVTTIDGRRVRLRIVESRLPKRWSEELQAYRPASMTPEYRPPYVDLHKLGEDERIAIIGRAATAGGLIGVAVDDEPEKVKRYIAKVTRRFPTVRLVDRTPGPLAGVVMLRFGPKPS